MIKAEEFCNALQEAGISFVAGVPDSLLAEFCACVADVFHPAQHVITANEGNAVGMAIGHYLSTGNPALVYMQNSGLGNAVNPITSLVSQEVYSIPMLFVIGWRGEIDDESGKQLNDEPQHVLQGKITKSLLDILGIQTWVIDENTDIQSTIEASIDLARNEQRPVALLVRKNTFEKYLNKTRLHKNDALTRVQALETVIAAIDPSFPVLSTTGKLSRELYELRNVSGENKQRDFLTVGGMGHASSIAAGFAINYPGKVVCLDGDGAILMHLGALTETAKCANLIHIVFNNGAHESVGGQPTMALELSLAEIARKCGYGSVVEVKSKAAIEKALLSMGGAESSVFIEIHCSNSSNPELGRPNQPPRKNRDDFMDFVKQGYERH